MGRYYKLIEGYYLDKLGNVYSNNKFNKITKLRLAKDNNGYLRVKIKNKTFKVHRLMGIRFLPNIKNKETINHKNGIKTDNRLSNLEWATKKENSIHAYKTGLHKPYIEIKDKGNNKYAEIWRDLYLRGNSFRKIGRQYGVSHHTIVRTINKCYKREVK